MAADRRSTLIGLGAAAIAMAGSSSTPARAADAKSAAGAGLSEFAARLRKLPRRRDFKTVPMILDNPDLWDSAALNEVRAYKGAHKQVWNNTRLAGPWLNVMRNSLNTQVFSFRHPDFLVVSATHGPAQLALYDQEIWDKYALAQMAGGRFKTNSLVVRKDAPSAADSFEDPKSIFGSAGNTIPALQDRGVVFLACHNAIWELSEKLMAKGVNPDNHSQNAMAAELTNRLIDGAVLIPGAVATLVELQEAGFRYAS